MHVSIKVAVAHTQAVPPRDRVQPGGGGEGLLAAPHQPSLSLVQSPNPIYHICQRLQQQRTAAPHPDGSR